MRTRIGSQAPHDPAAHLSSLVARATPLGAERIHPTWFVSSPAPGDADGSGQRTPLPEAVLEHLPLEIRDSVALLLPGTSRNPGRLSEPAAREVAKRLWSHLAPMPTVATGNLLEDLPLAPPQTLKGIIRKTGARLLGLMLSTVPERAAAALTQTLPQDAAADVWLYRRQAKNTRPKLGSLAAEARKISTRPAAESLNLCGARVMATALKDRRRRLTQVAQRLPRALGRMILDAADRSADKVADRVANRTGDENIQSTRNAVDRRNVVDQSEAQRWLSEAFGR